MKRKLTPEQEQARDERRARFRALVKQLADMPEVDRAQLVIKAGAVVTCEGRALSMVNTMLLMLQIPNVSCVGGFRQWIKAGRCVRKGEHGATIWIPTRKGDREATAADVTQAAAGSEATEVRFFTGTVFDISQTEEVNQQAA